MNRRDALKKTALFMGYAVSASTVAAVLNGCKADTTTTPTGWQPSFLSTDQFNLVSDLAEAILPKTDTPGAKDVFVDRFIDEVLNTYQTKKVRDRFMAGLDAFQKECTETNGKGFSDCTPEQQHSILTKYDKETKAIVDKLDAEYEPERQAMIKANEKKTQRNNGYIMEEKRPFFALLKEMTMVGYFTSELVGKEVLNYDPIPGAYDGCTPMPANGRIWSYKS